MYTFIQTIDGFAKLGFSHCVGAIGGWHVQIVAPPKSFDAYINRKSYHSMVMQGTVDHKGKFINISIGWSGRHLDSHVFKQSYLLEAMEAGVFVPGNPTRTIRGMAVHPLIVGNAAYPLKKRLMKPYRTFDMRFASTRNVVECAFGRLKARWNHIQLLLIACCHP